jgi:hypothetical protein
MHSQPLPGKASRRRAEEQFKTAKKVNSETKANTPRQAEAEKTARLRVLRLAKEAADKDTANRDAAAAKARRSEPRRRVAGSQAQVRQHPGKGPRTGARRWAQHAASAIGRGLRPGLVQFAEPGIGVGLQDAGPTREMPTRVLAAPVARHCQDNRTAGERGRR